jgi:predicted O-methyltransferase YrrM
MWLMLSIFILLILNVGKGNKMKYNKPTILLKYIAYLLKASNGKGHGIHSPFVFSFIKNVLNAKTQGAWVDKIEKYRTDLSYNKQAIKILDLGAGATKQGYKVKQIAEVAKGALKSKKYSALLNRMLAYFKPIAVLEMGTSLGITTCYLAQALPDTKIVTMEGAPAIAELALATFENVGYKNIQVVVGNFDQNLPLYLKDIDYVGFVFIDGNHSYEPTMTYFNCLLSKSNEDAIFIFDDIHWSKEMENAWEEIKADERVSLTIDLFYIGIVFLKKENKEKENFIIRF